MDRCSAQQPITDAEATNRTANCTMNQEEVIKVSSQLRSARRARGLAIWGLSVMSGVSPSLLTAIEKWGYVPGVNTRKRIADALGMRVEEIWPQKHEGAQRMSAEEKTQADPEQASK